MKNQITLYQAFDGFLVEASAEGKSAYTIRNYKTTIAKVKLFFSDDRPMTSLTRQDWVDFMAWLQEEYVSEPGGVAHRESKRLSPKTCNNVHTDLKAFYTWATSDGVNLVDEHPIKQIPAPRYEIPEIEVFDREQVRALLRACNESAAWCNKPNQRNKRPTARRDVAIVHTLLSTGIRASELCNIQLRDLNMDAKTISVAGKGRGRDSKPRIVYFGKVCNRALWAYLTPHLSSMKPDDHIFTVGGVETPRPMSRDSLLQLINRLGDRTGIDRVYPHRFRHTFATEFLRNGGDMQKLKTLLGHTSLEMVLRYVHFVEADCALAHAGADPADNWKI